MQQRFWLLCALHATLGLVVMATTTPAAAQATASLSQPTCPCGPSALPAYVPPYPKPAARPIGRPQDGVAYRDGNGFRPARTDLGASAFESHAGLTIWSGLYLGLHGGYAFGQTTIHEARLGKVDTNGGFGGLHIGHNWQIGSVVFGVEADANRSFASGTRSFPSGFDASASREWSASGRVRAGVTFGSLLAYATAGGAVGGQSTTVGMAGTTWRGPETHFGYVYGGGLEWQMSRSISLRGEVLRYDFNERTMHVGGGQSPLKLDDMVVRGGLSYRFN
jgi:outer membrane immunogenic protein